MDREEYFKTFCQPYEVSKMELMRTAIANGKKRGYKLSGYRKLRRKQLTAIVNKEEDKPLA